MTVHSSVARASVLLALAEQPHMAYREWRGEIRCLPQERGTEGVGQRLRATWSYAMRSCETRHASAGKPRRVAGPSLECLVEKSTA